MKNALALLVSVTVLAAPLDSPAEASRRRWADRPTVPTAGAFFVPLFLGVGY
jgi:hypothetical protein